MEGHPRVATAVQSPHRLGLFLAIAATGLFAAALDSSLIRKASGEGSRQAMAVMLMVIAVIVGGVLTWRTDWTWLHVLRDPPMVHAVLNRRRRSHVSNLCSAEGFARICQTDWSGPN